jgi:hypothetical protein
MSLLKNSVSDTISVAVTIPCCANRRGRRYIEDDGRAATDRVVVLLLPFGRSDSQRSPSPTPGPARRFQFCPERLRMFYNATGRPSIDPEVLLRLLWVGYLYGITSERRLLEEVRMHLAYRWFSPCANSPNLSRATLLSRLAKWPQYLLGAVSPMPSPARNATVTSTEVRLIGPPWHSCLSHVESACQRTAGSPNFGVGSSPGQSCRLR